MPPLYAIDLSLCFSFSSFWVVADDTGLHFGWVPNPPPRDNFTRVKATLTTPPHRSLGKQYQVPSTTCFHAHSPSSSSPPYPSFLIPRPSHIPLPLRPQKKKKKRISALFLLQFPICHTLVTLFTRNPQLPPIPKINMQQSLLPPILILCFYSSTCMYNIIQFPITLFSLLF